MELELHQLELRYEGLKCRLAARERRLVASLADLGISPRRPVYNPSLKIPAHIADMIYTHNYDRSCEQCKHYNIANHLICRM